MRAPWIASRALLVVALLACGGSDKASGPEPTRSTPSIAISLSSNTLSILQGQSTTFTATVSRNGGFGGSVELSVDVPAGSGVTASVSTPSLATGATASTISVATSGTAPAGTLTLSVRARGVGVADVVGTVSLTITAAPKNLALQFCPSELPKWVATQDGDGAWTRVTPGADGIARVTMGARGGVATVRALFPNPLEVIYGTLAELAASYTGCDFGPISSGKTLRGSVAGLVPNDLGIVSHGLAESGTRFDQLDFTLNGVQSGALDLVAARLTTVSLTTGYMNASRVIVRRAQNYASGSTIPILNFNAAEAVAPAKPALTVNGAGTAGVRVDVDFTTADGAVASLHSSEFTGTSSTFTAMPAVLIAPTDLHLLSVADLTPFTSANPSQRIAFTFFRDPNPRQVTLGPVLAAPVIATTAGVRPRWSARLPVQTEYNSLALATFSQSSGTRRTSVQVSAAYRGSATSWDLVVPDLSAAGLDPSWEFTAGASIDWSVSAGGGFPSSVIDLVDGLTIVSAARSSFTPSSAAAISPAHLGSRSLMRRRWSTLPGIMSRPR